MMAPDPEAEHAFPEMSLNIVQRWMQNVLTHPAGVIQGARDTGVPREIGGHPTKISDVVTASKALSAEARLAVYAHAYSARLMDCLRAEFPAVLQAAGDEAFNGLGLQYLAAAPSDSYTLHDFGSRLPEFLASTRPPRDGTASADYADFLIDLARLERCYSEVFASAGPETLPGLTAERLRQLTPEQFASSQVTFFPSVRLLTLRFPCHVFASAVRQGEEPAPPAAQITYLVVFRRDYIVRRLEVTSLQYQLLERLSQGETISDAIQAVCGDAALGQPDLQSDFARWTTAPLIQGLKGV